MSPNITLFWGNDRGVLSLNNIRSTTVLVAALVTAVVVVGVLLGVIFCLFRRMRRLTTAEDSKNTQSHSNDENESRPRDLYEDSTARLSQHEYQEIDKVQLFRHNKVNDDDGNIENTYTEIIPDIDTNYVTLENDSSGKRQTGPEWISTHNTLDEPDNSQKESTGRVNLSFETDSTYFVLDKI
ncbi:hypothetical protein FSP39_018329 [Pinctada imbricata]|uniref:Uncharacterized protein n=1 Tax=Pinctada imbricata TaxID=66713 RepID=A0AA88YRQ4_PINIB|nr:hypothetical protein FSP39_018329 [Pinctada imbricata]